MSGDAKRAAVVHLVKSRGLNQVIVFSNTKIGTGRLARQLERDGVRAESIHGDKSQIDRMKALDAFKAGELEVLVATDVAARGLDVAGVPVVINYDLPHNAEDYVHRIGRTGRAGLSGEAISLFSPAEERYLLDIEKLTRKPIERGTLQVPGELIARTHELDEPRARREHSRERHDRHETRPAVRPEARPDARPERAARPSRYSAPTKPVDEFFLKPYEPSPESAAAQQASSAGSAPSNAAPARRGVGLLLGGQRKKGD